MFQDALADGAVGDRDLPDRPDGAFGRRSRGRGHALCLRRRQTPARVPGAGNRRAVRWAPTGRSIPPPPSNACMPTASSMTTCPAWMTTTCARAADGARKWDEATAVLVGDALQTFAFELLTDPAAGDADQRVALVASLARASGAQGMVLGQAQDIAAETAGRPADPGRDHRASGQQDRPPDRMAGAGGRDPGPRRSRPAHGLCPRHRPRLPDRRRHPRRDRRQRERRARRSARMPMRARRPSSRFSASTEPIARRRVGRGGLRRPRPLRRQVADLAGARALHYRPRQVKDGASNAPEASDEPATRRPPFWTR
jgi:hypothetical protein